MLSFGHASFNVRFAQNPGRAHTSLRRRQLFQPNQPQNSSRRDVECGGAFTDGHLAAGLPLSLTVDRNRMVIAQGADMLRSPLLSVCRMALIPIQDRGRSARLVVVRSRLRSEPRHARDDRNSQGQT